MTVKKMPRKWKDFIKEVPKLSEKQAVQELKKELSGSNRRSFVKILFTRHCRLRRNRQYAYMIKHKEFKGG